MRRGVPPRPVPTSCANPAQASSGDNGNVVSFYYENAATPSVQDQVTNTYDALNRLTSSANLGASADDTHSMAKRSGSIPWTSRTAFVPPTLANAL